MKAASSFCIVFVTAGSESNAISISKVLIQKNLAACVNIFPTVRSIYRWKNKIHNEKELLLLIKTRKSYLKKVQKIILEHHAYETPEILAVSLLSGDAQYLHWLKQETTFPRKRTLKE